MSFVVFKLSFEGVSALVTKVIGGFGTIIESFGLESLTSLVEFSMAAVAFGSTKMRGSAVTLITVLFDMLPDDVFTMGSVRLVLSNETTTG